MCPYKNGIGRLSLLLYLIILDRACVNVVLVRNKYNVVHITTQKCKPTRVPSHCFQPEGSRLFTWVMTTCVSIPNTIPIITGRITMRGRTNRNGGGIRYVLCNFHIVNFSADFFSVFALSVNCDIWVKFIDSADGLQRH